MFSRTSMPPLRIGVGGRVPAFLGALAVAFAIAASVSLSGHVQLGLTAIALTLGLCALGVAVAGLVRGWRMRQHLSALRRMLHADPGAAFVTDAGGVMQALNPALQAQMGRAGCSDLATFFEGVTAHPRALLMRLQAKALRDGAAGHTLGPEAAAQSLSVHPAGHGLFLWRLTPAAHTGQALSEGVPVMHVDDAGRILTLSPAMVDLLGGVPARVDAVLAPVPTRGLERVLLRPMSVQASGMPAGRRAVGRGLLPAPMPARTEHALPGGTEAGGTEAESTEAGGTDPAARAEGARTRPYLAETLPAGAPGQRRILLLPYDPAAAPVAGPDPYEALPVALLQLLPDGTVLRANATARRLLAPANAVGDDGLAGLAMADLVEGLGRSLPDWLIDVHAGRATSASEVVRLRGGPEDAFVQIALHPDPVEQGLIAVLSDATAIKTLEAQFVQSQKMQAIGQLAGGVAHDFNNLLAAIAGHCDLMLLRHRATDADYPDLVQISQNTNRAAALVGQLLAFSRKQTLKAEQIDPAEVLSDMTHLLNRLVGARVHLAQECDAGVGPIRADRRQLEQVLMNLVVNARDAMPEGGQVTISARRLRLDAPLVRDRARVPAGEYALISVADQGVGIAPDRIDKIFEPFYTTKRPGEGTGLGLSTAYGIVKQTGGFIFADSTPGAGATFSLYFPVNHDAVPEDRALAEGTLPARLGQGVVLLVEDEAPVRAFAARALSLRGYVVVEADSGEAALALLDDPDLKVDIIVTDVIMPGLDGPGWVRRALPFMPDVRVVFMSGYTDEGFEAERALIPNSAFLAKPFALEALVNMVQGQNLH